VAKAAWLSPRRLASWLRSVGYTGGVSAEILHASWPLLARWHHLRPRPPPQPPLDIGHSYVLSRARTRFAWG